MNVCRWSVLAVLAGCSYHPGSFRDHAGTWAGTTTTLGCIDVAVANGDEVGATGTVIAYGLGNRCERRVVVDLGSVRAVGRDFDGRERPLVAYDPRGELRPIRLHALWSGRAQVAYRGVDANIASICVDIGRIDRSVATSERWICVAKGLP